MTIEAAKLSNVKSKMDARYENKQSNKKTTISGSYTGDNDSYPTVLACINKFGELVTTWSLEPSDSKYPSEKLVKGELNKKIDKSSTVGLVKNDGTIDTTTYLAIAQGSTNASKNVVTDASGNITFEAKPTIPTKTSDLTNDSGFLTNHQSLESTAVTVEKQATAETGYASTYVVKQNGVQVGQPINVEKDKMLRSISVETVGATPTTEESSYNMTTGDQYILMIVNTTDNDGTSRVILPITDVFDLQTADEITLTLSAGGVFSIKTGGVGTTHIANGAVTSDKIATSVKNTWLTQAEVDARINQMLDDFAELLDPTQNS